MHGLPEPAGAPAPFAAVAATSAALPPRHSATTTIAAPAATATAQPLQHTLLPVRGLGRSLPAVPRVDADHQER